MDGAQGNLEQQLVRPQTVRAVNRRRRRRGEHAPRTRERPNGPRRQRHRHGSRRSTASADSPTDGREYVVHVEQRRRALPPAPWSNVVAQPTFRIRGLGARARLHLVGEQPRQPADAVAERSGQRSVRAKSSSSATRRPAGSGRRRRCRRAAACPTRSVTAQGYTTYEHARDGIESVLTVSSRRRAGQAVPARAAQYLRPRPHICRSRSTSIGCSARTARRTQLHIVTDREPATGAVTATNAFRDAFADRVAFVDLFPGERADHRRPHRVHRPQRLAAIAGGARLATGCRIAWGRRSIRAAPCRSRVALDASSEYALVGQLGEARDVAGVRTLVERFRADGAANAAVQQTRAFWSDLTGTVQVRTPDAAMDLMLNRWLLYQTLSCRIWGRSAFYQSSGAFGFRDQLQDVLALLVRVTRHARAHLLHAASRQFVEGDVQHWWHEPGGQGVRTRILRRSTLAGLRDAPVRESHRRRFDPRRAGAVSRGATAQRRRARSLRAPVALARERVALRALRARDRAQSPDRSARPAADGHRRLERRDEPGRSGGPRRKRLARLVSRSAAAVRSPISPTLAASTIAPSAYRHHASGLAEALDAAWDGDWYRRAYFDDGTPLGSAANAECRIDCDRAVVGGHLRQGRCRSRARRRWNPTDANLVRRNDGTDPAADAAVRQDHAEPRLHPGLRAWRAREWRAVHARRALDRARVREARRRRPRGRALLAAQPGQSRTHAGRDRSGIAPSPTSSRQTSTRNRRTPVAADGPGTRDRPAGCTASASRRSSACRSTVAPCASTRASQSRWPRYEMTFRSRGAEYQIVVENPDGVNRGVRSVEIDGRGAADHLIPIIDDGGVHHVRVVLGKC